VAERSKWYRRRIKIMEKGDRKVGWIICGERVQVLLEENEEDRNK
jgi:hypothetical protein